MNQHVSLTFSLKYLVNFAKSSSLSDDVQLMMSNDVPLLVSMTYVLFIDLSLTLNRTPRCPINSDPTTFATTSHPKSETTSRIISPYLRCFFFSLHTYVVSSHICPKSHISARRRTLSSPAAYISYQRHLPRTLRLYDCLTL